MAVSRPLSTEAMRLIILERTERKEAIASVKRELSAVHGRLEDTPRANWKHDLSRELLEIAHGYQAVEPAVASLREDVESLKASNMSMMMPERLETVMSELVEQMAEVRLLRDQQKSLVGSVESLHEIVAQMQQREGDVALQRVDGHTQNRLTEMRLNDRMEVITKEVEHLCARNQQYDSAGTGRAGRVAVQLCDAESDVVASIIKRLTYHDNMIDGWNTALCTLDAKVRQKGEASQAFVRQKGEALQDAGLWECCDKLSEQVSACQADISLQRASILAQQQFVEAESTRINSRTDTCYELTLTKIKDLQEDVAGLKLAQSQTLNTTEVLRGTVENESVQSLDAVFENSAIPDVPPLESIKCQDQTLSAGLQQIYPVDSAEQEPPALVAPSTSVIPVTQQLESVVCDTPRLQTVKSSESKKSLPQSPASASRSALPSPRRAMIFAVNSNDADDADDIARQTFLARIPVQHRKTLRGIGASLTSESWVERLKIAEELTAVLRDTVENEGFSSLDAVPKSGAIPYVPLLDSIKCQDQNLPCGLQQVYPVEFAEQEPAATPLSTPRALLDYTVPPPASLGAVRSPSSSFRSFNDAGDADEIARQTFLRRFPVQHRKALREIAASLMSESWVERLKIAEVLQRF